MSARLRESTLEPRYILMYHLGFSHSEILDLPLWQVKWYINRLKKDLEEASKAGSAPNSKAEHLNSPISRAFSGKPRLQAPHRLRK